MSSISRRKKKQMEHNKSIKIGFWGGPEYSVQTLEKLHAAGFTICFIATSLDQPKGRNLILTAPPAKTWGLAHNVPVLQPEKLKDEAFQKTLADFGCDVFVVMAYGRIMPEAILNIPKGKSINIHPSLLPKFRGPCPIESAILADEKETGVSIMLMDTEMDHGPILAQKTVVMENWPPFADKLGKKLVDEGVDLLISILPDWINGSLTPTAQNHAAATYTQKIKKEDGLIDLAQDAGNARSNYLKFKAYKRWPSAYFFKNETRVKITEASYIDGKFVIEKVIPEGKSEMLYTDFR